MSLFSAKTWFRAFLLPYLAQIKSVLVAVYVRYVDVKTINSQALVANGGGNIDIMGPWTVNSALVIGAITTAPTKATNRIRDYMRCRTISSATSSTLKEKEFDFAYAHSSATGSATGSGPYLLTLNNGEKFDITKHPIYNNPAATITDAIAAAYAIPGAVCNLAVDAANSTALIVPFSETQFRIFSFKGDAETAWLGSGYYQLGYWTNLSWSGNFRVYVQ